MKKHMIAGLSSAGLGLAALTSGVVLAQSQEETAQEEPAQDQDDAQREKIRRAPPDPEALQEALRARARRLPKRGLASALRAARDERSNRAETVRRAPNLVELRADLQRTEAEDAERPALREQLSATRALASETAAPPPGIRAMAARSLRSADEDEVDRVRIPVLIPADPAVRDKIKVYGMENVYTATATIDAEATLSITGTCNRVVGGDPDVVEFRKRLDERSRRLAGTGAAYHISRNDFGVDLSFSKFGCGYVMTVECGDPSADERCSGDDYVTGLADSMILANPGLAEGGE